MPLNDSIEQAVKILNQGPRGGDLDRLSNHPAARRSDFKGEDNGSGLPTLHRFERKHEDVARQGLQNEQPWHRMAAFMLLAGRTNSEIALAAQRTKEEVSTLRAQRWFQQLLAVLANETGEDVTGLLQSEAVASIEKLVSLRDYSSSDRVQLSASVTLLEHAKGKPVQSTITHSRDMKSSKLSPQEEMNEINEELARLRSQKKSTLEDSIV